jgi:hypothetical protein
MFSRSDWKKPETTTSSRLSRAHLDEAYLQRQRPRIAHYAVVALLLLLLHHSSPSATMKVPSLLPLAFAGTAYAAAITSRASSGDCNALWEKAPTLLANLEVYAAESLPGSSFSICSRLFSLIRFHSSWHQLLCDWRRVLCGLPVRPFPTPSPLSSAILTVENSAAVPDLAAFCRFGAWIHTSNVTKVQFEVWLPEPDVWSGRFAHVGNGVRFPPPFFRCVPRPTLFHSHRATLVVSTSPTWPFP